MEPTMTNHLIPLTDNRGRYTYINAHTIESVRFVPNEGKAIITQSGKPTYYQCKTREAFSALLDIINSYLSNQQPLTHKLPDNDQPI